METYLFNMNILTDTSQTYNVLVLVLETEKERIYNLIFRYNEFPIFWYDNLKTMNFVH